VTGHLLVQPFLLSVLPCHDDNDDDDDDDDDDEDDDDDDNNNDDNYDDNFDDNYDYDDDQYLGAVWQASSWAAFSAIFCAMPFCRKVSNFALPMYMFETDARNLQNKKQKCLFITYQ